MLSRKLKNIIISWGRRKQLRYWKIDAMQKIICNVKIRRCGMIVNEATLHERPNNTEINNYRSPYDFQKWV